MNRHALRFAALLLCAPIAGCLSSVDPIDAIDGAPGSDAVIQGEIGYRASTAILESYPVQLHTTVVMINRGKTRAEVRLASGCPVHLRAYRNEERTRLAWDQGQQLVCTKQIQVIDLAPADTAQRSTRSNARDILGDSLPDGRYWLAAYVQVVGAPVLVSTGYADLSVPRR